MAAKQLKLASQSAKKGVDSGLCRMVDEVALKLFQNPENIPTVHTDVVRKGVKRKGHQQRPMDDPFFRDDLRQMGLLK